MCVLVPISSQIGFSVAHKMVLFERATFLVIAHATHAAHSDVHRFEKISNIIKQFKLR